MKAAEQNNWERIETLHLQWKRAVSQCMSILMEASDEGQDTEAQLQRLLDDVREKTQRLEALMGVLQEAQQRDLARLQQTQAYLK